MKLLRLTKKYVALLISAFLCMSLVLSSASEGEVSASEVAKDENLVDLRVFELTAKNFASFIGDGNVWLIEFYTPWCGHCRSFSQSYNHVALTFHSSPHEKIRVGKVDCSVEKSLANRFGVNTYPMFFLVDGWNVYEFENSRSEANLMDFARGGYKKQDSIPFLFSPMGPMGLLQQILVDLGGHVMDIFFKLQTSFGISPILTGMLVCGFGIFAGIASIVVLTVVTTPKAKVD